MLAVRRQVLNLNFSRLWRYWQIAVNVVDSSRILKVNLEDVASVCIIRYAIDIEVLKLLFSHPVKFFLW